MASTRSSPRLPAVAWAACLAAAGLAHAQESAPPEQINLNAESWTRSGSTYTIRELTIEGGDFTVEADEAVTTNLEFRGQWRLSGSIRMQVGTARLLADTATFDFEAGELVAAELAGDPATFEDTAPEQAGPERAGPARGEAMRIIYDSAAGTVRMEGGASFTLAQNSISGCDFVYDLDGGLRSGSGECGVPLEIIYRPSREDAASEEPPDGASPPEDTETSQEAETPPNDPSPSP